MSQERVSLTETFGLRPFDKAFREAKLALLGDEYTPKSHFGPSSLKHLHPKLSVMTWLGRHGRQVPITNLFNRTQTPIEQGWSVRHTQVRDFRGKAMSYDSHNGIDFAVVVGSVVTAAAPGIVAGIYQEFHRGGLKVMIDHGNGLCTTSNHLARADVQPGQRVKRGERIGLSGYSGLDGFLMFPWSVPHVHFNTWLNGVPTDPFATADETPLWLDQPMPLPWSKTPTGLDDDCTVGTDQFDLAACARVLASCRDPEMHSAISAIRDDAERWYRVLSSRIYYPTRYTNQEPIYIKEWLRVPRMNLPFTAADVDGCVFADEI